MPGWKFDIPWHQTNLVMNNVICGLPVNFYDNKIVVMNGLRFIPALFRIWLTFICVNQESCWCKHMLWAFDYTGCDSLLSLYILSDWFDIVMFVITLSYWLIRIELCIIFVHKAHKKNCLFALHCPSLFFDPHLNFFLFFFLNFTDKTCCFQSSKLDDCCQLVFFDVNKPPITMPQFLHVAYDITVDSQKKKNLPPTPPPFSNLGGGQTNNFFS